MEKFLSSMQQTAWYLRVQVLLSGNAWKISLALLALLLYTQDVYAMADIQTIMSNLRRVIKPLTIMILAISYTMGVYMIFSGLGMMKKLGNISTANQAQPGELSGPLLKIIIGAALIYLPSSTDTMTNSLFSSGGGGSLFGSGGVNYAGLGSGASLLGYGGGDSLTQQWASIANTLVMYIQFLGLLSFVKGLFIMSAASAPGTQPGVVAKGITHMIGGIIAMNFVTAVNVINNTIFSS